MVYSSKDKKIHSTRSKTQVEDKKRSRKIKDDSSDDELDSEEESEEWSTEEENDDDQESEDDEDDEPSSEEDTKQEPFERLISKLVSTRQKERKDEKRRNKQEHVKSKKSRDQKRRHRRRESESEEDDEDQDEDYVEEDDELEFEDEEDRQNFIIMLNGGEEEEDSEENLNILLEKNEEEYGSEDEKIFMKEDYQDVEYPKDLVDKKRNKKNKNKRDKNSKQNELTAESGLPKLTVSEEYQELVDLKKHLSAKLKRNPNSKTLINHMKECCESIRKLVKDNRKENAKEYFKLIKNEKKDTMTEIEYFKNKLSHKEQMEVIKQMQIINDHNNIDKPYRLSLLQANIPAKYKATVMNKLNMMKTMEPGDSEYHKLKTWVDTFMRIPFNVYKSFDVKIDDGMEVCNQFMTNAREQLDNCVYGHNDAKLQIMQMIGQWISNPSAMGSAIAIHGPMGTGKCLAKDTPILMYDGSTKMVQYVKAGEQIMGDDSTPRTVLSLAHGEDQMYDVVYPDKSKYTVNSAHILSLIDTNTNQPVDMPILEYMNHPNKHMLKGYRTAVDFASKETIYDPYMVGLSIAMVKSDSFLRNRNNYSSNYHGGQFVRSIINKYDLKCNRYIPKEYLTNDRKTRMAVLFGILDGLYLISGYTWHEALSKYEIQVSDETRFANHLIYLARSLGLEVSSSVQHDRTYHIDTYRIYITFQKGLDASIRPAPILYDIDIIPCSSFDNQYYGFEIDGNRRFVLSDFTVTHNTSLVKDGISKILGREFAFIPLGGAGDSSFLEGHSYTYEGSMWGKIVQILIESKCMNPVIYFDELDKVSDSSRGQEIIGILTHLIDTSQNTQYHDKYFNEVDFDLSKCLFIFSYNDENLVNPILRDRMYKIKTKGYETNEKMVISKKYMLPKIREKVNFKEGEIIISDDTLQYIITSQKFTNNEQGVRNLNRCLEIIHTKLNLFRLMHIKENDPLLGKDAKIKVEYPFTVTRKDVDILIRNEENQNQSLLAMYV